MIKNQQIEIPEWMMQVKYNGRIIPNGTAHDIAKTGANCQVFAFHLLRHYDRFVPGLRSSELWEDTSFSKKIIENYEPLDLLFFHKKNEAYGAHIAIYIGNNQAIHNTKKIGLPIIWDIDAFSKHPEYTFLLGAKRFFKKDVLKNSIKNRRVD